MISLLRAYVASRAYRADPKRLLWDLQEYKGDLRPLSELIFDACDRFADATSAMPDGGDSHWSLDFQELSVLLLRLYGQVQPPHDDSVMRKKCLDRWDSMLRKGNGTLPSTLSLLDATE